VKEAMLDAFGTYEDGYCTGRLFKGDHFAMAAAMRGS
jgi:hypothetical protein